MFERRSHRWFGNRCGKQQSPDRSGYWMLGYVKTDAESMSLPGATRPREARSNSVGMSWYVGGTSSFYFDD
jgi:hypothetical protein